MTKTYHANGKLLLTGEYFILDGAVGLAAPTQYGQTLTVEETENNEIYWKSIDSENKIWFEAKFSTQLEIIETTHREIAKTLQHILSHCELSTYNIQLTTRLDFPNNWGLGSSSTLISLLAQWQNINPYELLAKTFGGSGYDIACATAKSTITYQIVNKLQPIAQHQILSVNFNPSFSNHLYFLHLNKKQNSRDGINHYRQLPIDKEVYIEELSILTQKIINAIDFDEFCYYLEVHENIIAQSLNITKIKNQYFEDFPGAIKSLGAWGGDFVWVACDEPEHKIRHYFNTKGYPTLLRYQEMIL
ncbi:MAG TPA: GYDIA family GHMP kinase [Chitinophagales bacterium]|nr:GYDIA family GHMP kinase [Chitinophagales bacterium]HNM32338.1 GYDIA family GHMP kinase [Chitinophagales bacterium]